MILRKTLGIAFFAASICCFAQSSDVAAATAPIITYTASGTFATPATSGSDTLKLAGEPFSVSIAVSAATKPFKTSSNSATYNKLKLTGTVHSGLLGSTPVTIASSESTIIQSIDPGKYDLFTMEAPVNVIGISLTIKAVITMPVGTITKPLLHPFTAPVSVGPGNGSVTYSDGTTSTVLAIQTGSITATIPAAAVAALPVVLHQTGAQAFTLHGDGATSVRSIGATPVDLGFSTDSTILKFYATGVSGASEVHVQIAGVEAPVVYSGASGYFPGLDEVMVRASSTLAGSGSTSVALTADGQAAEPVRIQIQ